MTDDLYQKNVFFKIIFMRCIMVIITIYKINARCTCTCVCGGGEYIPYEAKGQQFLEVKGEIWPEGGFEEGCDGLFVLEQDGCKAKEKRTTHGSKETPPVVPHSKVGSRYLYTEQHT